MPGSTWATSTTPCERWNCLRPSVYAAVSAVSEFVLTPAERALLEALNALGVRQATEGFGSDSDAGGGAGGPQPKTLNPQLSARTMAVIGSMPRSQVPARCGTFKRSPPFRRGRPPRRLHLRLHQPLVPLVDEALVHQPARRASHRRISASTPMRSFSTAPIELG